MVSLVSELCDRYSALNLFLISTLSFRFAQRIYFLGRGNKSNGYNYDPESELLHYLDQHNISFQHCILRTSHDGTLIRYDKIGSGSKPVLLANGIGTKLWVWLPTIQHLFKKYPNLFNEFTLISPVHRGLFEPDELSSSLNHHDVQISILNCTNDLLDIIDHAKIDRFDSIIGWSVGTQIALTCGALYPSATKKMLLLCPTTGETLHTVLQPLFPLPPKLSKSFSGLAATVCDILTTTTDGVVYDIIHYSVYESYYFRMLADSISFFFGLSPEFGSFATAYFRDVVSSRRHTKALINLIRALDAPLPPGGHCLEHSAVIVSALFDNLTGLYHAEKLHRNMLNSHHVCFTMASHFLLIEWPDLLAEEILKVIRT